MAEIGVVELLEDIALEEDAGVLGAGPSKLLGVAAAWSSDCGNMVMKLCDTEGLKQL